MFPRFALPLTTAQFAFHVDGMLGWYAVSAYSQRQHIESLNCLCSIFDFVVEHLMQVRQFCFITLLTYIAPVFCQRLLSPHEILQLTRLAVVVHDIGNQQEPDWALQSSLTRDILLEPVRLSIFYYPRLDWILFTAWGLSHRSRVYRLVALTCLFSRLEYCKVEDVADSYGTYLACYETGLY